MKGLFHIPRRYSRETFTCYYAIVLALYCVALAPYFSVDNIRLDAPLRYFGAVSFILLALSYVLVILRLRDLNISAWRSFLYPLLGIMLILNYIYINHLNYDPNNSLNDYLKDNVYIKNYAQLILLASFSLYLCPLILKRGTNNAHRFGQPNPPNEVCGDFYPLCVIAMFIPMGITWILPLLLLFAMFFLQGLFLLGLLKLMIICGLIIFCLYKFIQKMRKTHAQ